MTKWLTIKQEQKSINFLEGGNNLIINHLMLQTFDEYDKTSVAESHFLLKYWRRKTWIDC
jgi:hypothetical protein